MAIILANTGGAVLVLNMFVSDLNQQEGKYLDTPYHWTNETGQIWLPLIRISLGLILDLVHSVGPLLW